MTDEEIVERIDFLNSLITEERCILSRYYRERRELRKQLEQNHRIKTNI